MGKRAPERYFLLARMGFYKLGFVLTSDESDREVAVLLKEPFSNYLESTEKMSNFCTWAAAFGAHMSCT